MEGDQLYQQYGMLSTEDAKEYERMLGAYDATYQHRNQLYNEAYGQYRDEMSDAFSMANLEATEHGQKVADAQAYYNTASNYADTMYEREYNSWADSINQAWQAVQMENSDAWNTKNFDEGVRQYEKNFAENARQFDMSYAQNEDHFTRNLNFQASENAKDRAIRNSGGGGGGNGKIVRNGVEYDEPTQTQKANALKAYNEGGEKAYDQYLDSLPSNVDIDSIDAYVFGYTDEEGNEVKGYGVLPYSDRTYTVVEGGGTNWGWGVDNNAKVTDQYDNEYTLEQLAEHDKEIAEELSKKKYTKGSTYTKKK